MKTCNKCAMQVDDNAVFCDHCGNKIEPLTDTTTYGISNEANPVPTPAPTTQTASQPSNGHWAFAGMTFIGFLISLYINMVLGDIIVILGVILAINTKKTAAIVVSVIITVISLSYYFV